MGKIERAFEMACEILGAIPWCIDEVEHGFEVDEATDCNLHHCNICWRDALLKAVDKENAARWENVKVDTVVEVKNALCEWKLRRFAKYSLGQVHVFPEGLSSDSAVGTVAYYPENVRLVNP